MELFKIQAKLFGEIEFASATDDHYDDYDVTLGGKKMTITLTIDEGFVDSGNIKMIEGMLDHIPEMHKKAKLTILNDIGSNEVIRFYVECYFGVDSIDEIDEANKKMIAEKLEPETIAIDYLSDEKIYCRFDFTLSDTDEILVISFDTKYEICHITHES